MEKFSTIMYDFFAFALPGACIIISISLLQIDDKFLYKSITQIDTIKENIGYFLLALAISGYIIGYIIKPIARSIFLFMLSTVFFRLEIYIFRKIKSNGLNTIGTNSKKLVKSLIKKDRAYKLIQIKELTPKSYQYIEFWDMHMSMAHNLAFASLVFSLIQIINLSSDPKLLTVWSFIALGVIAFFILLRIASKFAYWWCTDINAAIKYIEVRGLMGKDKKSPLWYG